MANTQTSVPVFTSGQVLTAAQQTEINTGIPVFADSAARDAAFGGTGEKTLAEGQFAFLEDSDTTQYYDGATWEAVAGASGGMTLISTTTISGSSVNLTSIPQTHKNLQLIVRNFLPANDNTGFRVQMNTDSNANRHSSATLNTLDGQSFTSTSWTVFPFVDNAVTQGLCEINIYDYTNTTTFKFGDWIQIGNNATDPTTYNYRRGAGFYNQIDAISSINFVASSGNFTSGEILLYGVS